MVTAVRTGIGRVLRRSWPGAGAWTSGLGVLMVLGGVAVVLGVWGVTGGAERSAGPLGSAEDDLAEPPRVIVSGDADRIFRVPLGSARARSDASPVAAVRAGAGANRGAAPVRSGGRQASPPTRSTRPPTPVTSTPTPTRTPPPPPSTTPPPTGGGSTGGTAPVAGPVTTPPPVTPPTTPGNGSINAGIEVIVSATGTTINVASGISVTLPASAEGPQSQPQAIAVKVPGLPGGDLAVALPE